MMIYLRYTDNDGKVWINDHVVWDRDRFLAAQKKAYGALGGKVEQVTAKVYREHAWRKREPA